MIILCSNVQGEDIFARTNGVWLCVYILVCKRKIFLSILMADVNCVHFSQLVDHCVT